MITRQACAVLVVTLVFGVCLATDAYQDMIYKSVRVNGAAAGAAGSNSVVVDSPGMVEGHSGMWQFSATACRTTGNFGVMEGGWATSSTKGRVAPRDGAIIASDTMGSVTVTSGNVSCAAVVYVNGSAVWSQSSGNKSGSGNYIWPSGGNVVARNTYTFNAGDLITVRCNQEASAGVGTCDKWNTSLSIAWAN